LGSWSCNGLGSIIDLSCTYGVDINNEEFARFANLLILPTYEFNLNDMQSKVISITCHGACHTAWHPNVWHPKAPNYARLYTTYWSKGVAKYNGYKVKCSLHQHPSFTHCHIRRSAHPPFTSVEIWEGQKVENSTQFRTTFDFYH